MGGAVRELGLSPTERHTTRRERGHVGTAGLSADEEAEPRVHDVGLSPAGSAQVCGRSRLPEPHGRAAEAAGRMRLDARGAATRLGRSRRAAPGGQRRPASGGWDWHRPLSQARRAGARAERPLRRHQEGGLQPSRRWKDRRDGDERRCRGNGSLSSAGPRFRGGAGTREGGRTGVCEPLNRPIFPGTGLSVTNVLSGTSRH